MSYELRLCDSLFNPTINNMKVELFALCQGAHNNNGQLTIVNTIDNFHVPSFPTRLSFGLALKFYILPMEEGDKVLTISILSKKTESSIISPIMTNLHIEKFENASHIGIALNLQNVLFETPGEYNVHLELDGQRFDDFAFEVR